MKNKDTNNLTRVAMLLLVALFSLTEARANELTVYDGTSTSRDVPAYIYYFDDFARSQFVIPATDLLGDMGKGATISALKFYTTSSNIPYTTLSSVDVYLKEVTYTTMTGLEPKSGIVYQGTLEIVSEGSGGSMTITFSTPFTYSGDANLLVGIENTTDSGWKSIYFYGQQVTGAAWSGSNSSSLSGVTGSVQNFIPKTTFTYFPAGAILPPTGLTVNYTAGTEATVSWTSTESAFDIEVNGVETSNITTNTYTLTGLEYATTYSVRVRAKKNGEVSEWTDPVTFRTASSANSLMINYSLVDSYGDGWSGNAINVVDEDGNVVQSLTISSGGSSSGTLDLDSGAHYEFVWVKGSYPSECSWTFTNLGGNVLFSGTGDSNMATGDVLYEINPLTYDRPTDLVAGTPDTHSVELSWTANSTATSWQICVNDDLDNAVAANSNPFTLTGLDADTEYSVKVRAYIDNDNKSGWSNVVTFTTAEAAPAPTDLAASDITTNSATLSWSGSNDSYVVQYRPWNPAGDDIQTTGTMVTYTYDLSAFTGTGSFAIRHYDISDMFSLIVDNIVVKDAGGNVVFSEDFETCGGTMPSAFTNMDLDGDGYTWEIASSDLNVDGSYGIVSASFVNYVGPVTPDNWLIINGIEMGGSISFSARGQDENYAAENFAVYISTENSIVEVPVNTKSYTATDLEPNTPYAWQVKGITGGEESRWASSFFKTLDDVFVFTTAGDWDNTSNWSTGSLPTVDNNIRIEANATIPAGVIAEGKKITIADGASITIEDGGELKHSSATLRVTMEKEIAAGENNLIASPFSGRTLLAESGSFSRVDNLIDGSYDYYAFDPTQANEWINYEANPSYNPYFEADNGLNGLLYGEGYLYANDASCVLEFIGTTWASNNHVETKDFDYDATSEASFNGWKLIGNPFTCTGYITYSEDATFYKLNAAGTGFDAYENAVALAPGEGAFMKVTASGTITYSSEPLSVTPVAAGSFFNLVLPAHGEETDQDADPTISTIPVTISSVGYSTLYYGTLNLVVPEGVIAYTYSYNGTKIEESKTYNEGEVIPAGTGVVLEANAGTYDFVVTAEAGEADENNALKGSDEEALTEGGDVYYALSTKGGVNVGFYWRAEGGAAFTNGAHKAYLALTNTKVKGFAIGLEDDATAIETIANGQQTTEGAIYNVAGQRLNKAQKGVNIVNGKKILK